ncbi:SusD/RagB family nutrient-binding outer membrane lipoprotein [Maribacter polysiphoniae]|uniref:SusD-like starch-binding protein associating with outer membrane n=1 Tax=Maribacter polysiphoniae TaxID=429344 RepID=A0A316E5Z3_9FLAO|nr:SusD/RagB family nutrient-binding outer membrane lipoprotein [Maribacter polysiphoniae]MBD1259494.1 SusD/RagB family nutrient-binding outer membrane lipoprotein [Maribacter polysiphoniae]PWK25058.1 SusD-like starch-binding protein associating with outer membrane [Maribacter polysiphoniae]
MKKNRNITYKGLVLILSVFVLTISCEKWNDSDINIDPDKPSDVSMALILPGVQQSMGFNLVGNNTVRTNNIWMQIFEGVDRQSFTEGRYQITAADTGNGFEPMYTEMMMNLGIIIDKADDEGVESPHFAGVAQVLTATTLGIGTDLFGDMPYTEAFKGGDLVYSPVYDTQESLYGTVNTLLDQAIGNLNSATNVIDVEGDVIYDGDIDLWKKAAYSIKARHAIQLSAKNGNAAYTAALAAVSNGFTSNDDDMLVPWEDANKNPLYQFMDERGDIRMGAFLIDLLLATDDPRLPFYAEKDDDGNYTGSALRAQNAKASKLGSNLAGSDAPTKLMTYSELKFIEAEARLGLGQAGAQEAYEEAVAASVLRVTGDANTAWLDANINGDPVTLEKLMIQKYIDGAATNQPYADYRRTGLPSLTLASDAVLSEIPVRFPYPQSELDYNTQNVPSVTLLTKVWWDQ